MNHYIVGFAFYTLAMVGIIYIGFIIAKSVLKMPYATRKNSILSVEDILPLTPRKKLYVIKVANERFLISGDVDNTTLLAKLEQNELFYKNIEIEKSPHSTFDRDELPEHVRVKISTIIKKLDTIKEVINSKLKR